MTHLFAPKPHADELPVFFNLDGVVGAKPAENIEEDVLFVQFAFKVIAESPLETTSPELLVAAKAVATTGSIDDATINAIRTHQQSFKKVNPDKIVDGRVSPAEGGYSYGAGFWTIVWLNESIQHRYLDVWPRIDKIPGCPEALKQMVKRQVVGI